MIENHNLAKVTSVVSLLKFMILLDYTATCHYREFIIEPANYTSSSQLS